MVGRDGVDTWAEHRPGGSPTEVDTRQRWSSNILAKCKGEIVVAGRYVRIGWT